MWTPMDTPMDIPTDNTGKPMDNTDTFHYQLIAAVDNNWGLSKDGVIPWKDTDAGRTDMRHFISMTLHNIVIMGSKTFDSIGKPLPNRFNIVITNNPKYQSLKSWLPSIEIGKFTTAKSFEDAVDIARMYTGHCMHTDTPLSTWIIGGAEVYKAAIQHARDGLSVCITRIPGNYDCDVVFPYELLNPCIRTILGDNMVLYNLVKDYKVTISDHVEVDGNVNNIESSVVSPQAIQNIPETEYLKLIKRLINAPTRPNRTGIHTHGLFAQSLRFPLTSNNSLIMPLITTKKVPFRLVATELQWFLSGKCTHIKQLTDNNNHIWDDNTTPEFHAKRGLGDYTPGECGPIYGYQWRNWNRDYLPSCFQSELEDCNECKNCDLPKRTGIDQLEQVIHTLKTDPYDRRMIVSAWNPEQLSKMVLPPCHWSFQFHCDRIDDNFGTQYPDLCASNINTQPLQESLKPKKYFLNCVVNMRSADICLGVPFNIASYALLTHIIARIVNMVPGELVIHMTDCHIYENHLEGARTQIMRSPFEFPTFEFGKDILAVAEPTLDTFINVKDQFIVTDYRSHPAIKYPMAI